MSSTSSSECECGSYWRNYETVNNAQFKNAFGGNPYYPTMGHPLIYYAEAPRPRNLPHRGRDRERGSPNCFVKAFRWYTKDHIPHRSESPITPDMSGFAAWLDVKYDQFLQERPPGSEMYHVKLRQTFEAEKAPATSNRSCRYIMQPKDVTRPPSVCCQPTNFTTNGSECAKKPLARSQSFSNMTMVIKSKEQCGATPVAYDIGDTKPEANVDQNNSGKNVNSKQFDEKVEVLTENKAMTMQDFGCQVGREIPTIIDAETQCDVMVPQNSRCGSLPSNQLERLVGFDCLGPQNKIQGPGSNAVYEQTLDQPILPCECRPIKCSCKTLDSMPRKPVSKLSLNTQRNVKLKSYEDVECQCPEEKVVSFDAQTQYVAQPTRGFVNNICECDIKGFKRNYQTAGQSVPVPNDKPCQSSCKGNIEEESMTERVNFAQTTSQTSNHSICFEKETVEYPFFLKIVCADKLSNENMKSVFCEC